MFIRQQGRNTKHRKHKRTNTSTHTNNIKAIKHANNYRWLLASAAKCLSIQCLTRYTLSLLPRRYVDNAHTHWRECGRGTWADTKPRRPVTYSSFNTPNSSVCCRTDHYFHRDLGLKRPESRFARISCSVQSLYNAVFVVSLTIIYSPWATLKNSQNQHLRVAWWHNGQGVELATERSWFDSWSGRYQAT